MGKVDGKVAKGLSQINMKETIALIKNMGLVFSLGQVEISTRESIKKMREMGMVR